MQDILLARQETTQIAMDFFHHNGTNYERYDVGGGWRSTIICTINGFLACSTMLMHSCMLHPYQIMTSYQPV
jgi:hypothetical protein